MPQTDLGGTSSQQSDLKIGASLTHPGSQTIATGTYTKLIDWNVVDSELGDASFDDGILSIDA